MTAAAFRIVPLAAVHDRSTFASGSEPLDRYLQERVTQAMTVDAKDEAPLRFYLHHGSIPLPESPTRLFLPLATVRP